MIFRFNEAALELHEDTGHYVVKSGSIINVDYDIDSLAESAMERRVRVDRAREAAKSQGWDGDSVLSLDVHFSSPSAAADFVAGDWRSGTQVWKNDAGKSLGDYGLGKNTNHHSTISLEKTNTMAKNGNKNLKTILVTGATRGIGRAITEKMLSEGSTVYGVYKESGKQADELSSKYGDKIQLIQADVGQNEHVAELIEQLKHTQLDGIVNNAGVVHLAKWDELDFDEWEETLAVNLTAPLKLVHGLRSNLKDGSAVVNIASVDGFCAGYDTVAYAASKAGLISVTKSLAAILGGRNIRVNAVAPGWVETEMTADSMPDESKELTPLKRNAKPEEIADVVSFLLPEQSSFISGTTITVDGGLTVVDYTLYKEANG